MRYRIRCANGTPSQDVAEDYALGLLHAEATALTPREVKQSCGPHTAEFFDSGSGSGVWLPVDC